MQVYIILTHKNSRKLRKKIKVQSPYKFGWAKVMELKSFQNAIAEHKSEDNMSPLQDLHPSLSSFRYIPTSDFAL